jgi:threonine synthase
LNESTYATELQCVGCGSKYRLEETVLTCSKCGEVLDVNYDLSRLKKRKSYRESLKERSHSLWRYREFLPILSDDQIVSLGEGLTPLAKVPRYARAVELHGLVMKLDYLNPTGSFKDRGTTTSVSKLKELGVHTAMDDSSGNAGSSLAAYCAAAGIECTLYVPATAPREKLTQAQMYGARINKITGSRTDVAKAAEAAWKTTRIFYASHNLSPFFFEGMKTVAYEICEDLVWQAPDHVIFPVGGGTLMAGAWKGFRELKELGWISRTPKLHCTQSDACMPIVNAFRSGSAKVTPVEEKETIAGGVRISNPGRGQEVLGAVRESGGQAIAVADDAILKHQQMIARSEGIFPEPTSCVPLAGLEKLREAGVLKADDVIVVPLTGFGLKDVTTAMASLSRNK